MTARDFLNQPYEQLRLIDAKKQKITFYKEMAVNVSSPGFEEHHNATRNTEAIFVRYLRKAMNLEEELKEDQKVLDELKFKVDIALDKMQDPKEEILLRYRYLKFMTIKEISREMNYSIRWIKRLHAQALRNFEIIWDSE